VRNESAVLSLVDQLMTIHYGTRDGYYQILADHGSTTYPELAALAGTTEASAQRWLETQVLLGVVTAGERHGPARERRYQLPAGRAAFLLDLEDPFEGEYSIAA
jgi:hypothetical protein